MTSPFLTIQNAVSFEASRVPILSVEAWRQTLLENCAEGQARITALFGETMTPDVTRVYCLLGIDSKKHLLIGAADFSGKNPVYASITPLLPEAHLFERELYEEFGILPEDHPWRKPVRKQENYSFYKIEGEGIHEVAVGPVHAGIIEPGHFRFQCHGEKALHLEIQLGYRRRGVEALMIAADSKQQAVLAESIVGDTVIGHGLAYCHAMEGLSERSITPKRCQSLRAIALELERLSNHIGDLGALAGDVGFLPAAAWFGRLRGDFLNMLMELTGNRYGRSFVMPGGVLFDITPEMLRSFIRRLEKALTEVKELAELFFGASSVLTRLEQTGVIKQETARSLGAVGLAARASNLLRDVRQDYPTGIYRAHNMALVKMSTGDVYARARLRSLESKRSLQFLRERLEDLSADKIVQPCGMSKKGSMIVSLIDGWRGEIVHIVVTDEKGSIRRYKIVDPSFHNWAALEMAMRGGQISDFPLCNKSFNLSYAGHDL